jgi:outer membrane biosynthesis protein TonB
MQNPTRTRSNSARGGVALIAALAGLLLALFAVGPTGASGAPVQRWSGVAAAKRVDVPNRQRRRTHALRHSSKAHKPVKKTTSSTPVTTPTPTPTPAPSNPSQPSVPTPPTQTSTPPKTEKPKTESPATEQPKTEKPTEPTQPGSPSDLLFRGTKIRDFKLNQSAPGAVTEVPDPAGSGQQVLQMTVKNSDVAPVTPTSDPRAQLLSPSIITPGEEFWWSGKFYLPSSFPTSVPGWLTVMEGPYGEPFDGTPPWHLEVNGSSLRWQRNGTYGYDVPWQIPVPRASWTSVLVHERFGSDGWVEMWVNGQQVTFFGSGSINTRKEAQTTKLSMATRDHSNDGGPNFTVIQSYRKAGMFDSVTLFQGPMAIGKTRASVE